MQHNCKYISPRYVFSYTEERWTKYFQNMVFKETVTVELILCKNQEIVFSLDGDEDFWDIVARILQGDTLAPYLFIVFLDYILGASIARIKENCFTLKIFKADDIQWKISQMHSTQVIERLSEIFQCKRKTCCKVWNRKQEGLASSWIHIKKPEKFVDLGCHILSTESDVNQLIGKEWTVIDYLKI